MLDTTKEFIDQENLKNVLLMGTQQTLKAGFFQQYLSKNNINVLLPSRAEIEYIGKKIETELELGKVVPSTQKKFAEIAESIISTNEVDALILGCTELPLIFDDIALPVKKVDVMNEHIRKLVGQIMK